MSMLFRSTAFCLLFILLPPSGEKAVGAGNATEFFFEANRAYKNGQYQKAAKGYLELIENGFDHGQVLFNLGNTYFRLGDLGKAVLYYERARLLIPRDDDLAFNLSQARQRVVDAVIANQTMSLTEYLGLDSLNLYEVIFAFFLCNAFFFGVLCIRLIRKAEWNYYLSILLAIFFTIGVLVLTLKWYESTFDDRAVVLSKEAIVRAGPNINDTPLFKIHEGTIVHYERLEGSWVLLHLSKDKRGWVEARQLEKIILQLSRRGVFDPIAV